jgi:hypothetical protein
MILKRSIQLSKNDPEIIAQGKKRFTEVYCRAFGGAERDRTADPLLAKQVLSQLSYSPNLHASLTKRVGPIG